MDYRGVGFLAVIWFFCSATPFLSPPPFPVSKLSLFLILHSFSHYRRSSLLSLEGGKGRVGKIPIRRPRESLIFCKSFNTLWGCPPSVASYLFVWISDFSKSVILFTLCRLTFSRQLERRRDFLIVFYKLYFIWAGTSVQQSTPAS